MKMSGWHKGWSGCVLIFLFTLSAFAQDRPMVKYEPGFKFRDGVYLSLKEFRQNTPSVAKQNFTRADRKGKLAFNDFMERFRGSEFAPAFLYVDANGNEQELRYRDVWGYCRNGVFYRFNGQDFSRLVMIGALCHFSERVQTYSIDNTYTDYDSIVQFLLDLEKEEISQLNLSKFSEVLARDAELSKEFEAIKSKRKRKQAIYQYMLKYNKKHPIYFPAT